MISPTLRALIYPYRLPHLRSSLVPLLAMSSTHFGAPMVQTIILFSPQWGKWVAHTHVLYPLQTTPQSLHSQMPGLFSIPSFDGMNSSPIQGAYLVFFLRLQTSLFTMFLTPIIRILLLTM